MCLKLTSENPNNSMYYVKAIEKETVQIKRNQDMQNERCCEQS